MASTEIWGGINSPNQAIIGTSENNCWKSRPGIKENIYELTFEPISLNGLTIKWVAGLAPKEYEIFVKGGKFWKMVYTTLG